MKSKTGKKAQKLRDSWSRWDLLQAEANRKGVSVQMLNKYPMHVRITGHLIVDYWPATQRAWVFGSEHAANVTPPEDAIQMALAGNPERFPEGALEHLRTIQ